MVATGEDGTPQVIGWRCPTPCDADCEAPCHEAHGVPYKRDPQHLHEAVYGFNTGDIDGTPND